MLSAYYDYALNAGTDSPGAKQPAVAPDDCDGHRSPKPRRQRRPDETCSKADNELDLSGNDIANMQSQLPSQLAAIDALLGRCGGCSAADSDRECRQPRCLAYGDVELVELAEKQNPELDALADEIRGRREGIRLAKLNTCPISIQRGNGSDGRHAVAAGPGDDPGSSIRGHPRRHRAKPRPIFAPLKPCTARPAMT